MKTPISDMLPLLPGETALPKAPAVVLDDGTNCIPQHYLSYQHTKQSVEAIIAEIDFDPKYILFVDEDNASIFIQVGIIGKDNYQAFDEQQSEKIVYGRRWRVEPQLPSSEIIQTAFLALVKAREHEIRELFKYKTINTVDTNGVTKFNTTSPFSCHHDLPLIAMSQATNTNGPQAILNKESLQLFCTQIRYDHARFILQDVSSLANGQLLLALNIVPDMRTQLPELLSLGANNTSPKIVSHILIDSATEDSLMYGLMDFVLQLSNRFAEEHFKFKGFARFSRKQSIQKISVLSARTRVTNPHKHDEDFVNAFANANYETDNTRVPKIRAGKLGNKIKAQLNKFDIKYGILPKNED